MRTRLAAFACVALVGCGGTAGDLIAFEIRPGSPAPASPTPASPAPASPAPALVLVTDDGRGRCGQRGALKPLTSERVIEARAVERDLAELATGGRSFEGAREETTFVARSEAGSVTWAETAAGTRPALARATRLALQLERELCG